MPARRLGLRQAALLGLLLCALFTSSAAAQVITSAIRGTVTSADDGLPIVGAEVLLVHVPSGNEKTALTNESGGFAFTGLRIGGPYTVTVQSLGFAPFEQKDVFLTAGRTRDLSVGLRLTEEIINITVTATPRNASQKTVVSAEDIGELPSISRDPKDVVRLTPGAYTEGPNKALSIDGANNRFNSITVDGTRQDDDFGLNASGYPTRRSPVALSAVEEVAVETSPFDVRYGKFLGGNVNIVTKTGTNEFHGQVLGTFANDALVGDKSRDNELKVDFREARFGATVGGPIIKDKVHFLASFEALDATTPVDAGPVGSDAANITSRVTQEEMERIQRIARQVYGFNPGEPAKSLTERDFKILGKLDWAINDRHRLSLSYQRTAGNAIQQGASSSDTTLSLSSNWYNAKDTLNTPSLRLFSDWNDKLSTELELSGKLVSTRQDPTEGNGFASMSITTGMPAPPGMPNTQGTVLLGPDEFRHANELDNDLFHSKAQASYLQANHLFTAGLEYDHLAIENLFVAGSNGVASYSSIDNFEMQIPSQIRYKNAITNNPRDAAADWTTSVISAYLQDQVEVTPDLTLQGGVRLETYHAGLTIPENKNFIRRYGFSNDETIDGKSSILPRFGASFRAANRLNLRGGFGLYGGGTPNVWLSNSYTNDGVRVDTKTATAAMDAAIINGFNGRDVPEALQNRLRTGDGNVDAIDPNFKIPTSWKLSAGIDYSFDIPGLGEQGKDVELKLNYTFSKVRYGIRWRDLRRNLDDLGDSNLPVGTLPDGRPYYDNVPAGGQFNPNRGFDLLLDNTDKGHSHSASLGIQKKFPFGLMLIGSYAYVNSQEVSPGTSSTSNSNYGLAAVVDPNDPDLATSNYEREHRLMGIVQFSRAILKDIWPCCNHPWKDMRTTFSLFVESRSGQPFSYTFAGTGGGTTATNNLARIFGEEFEFARRNRMLFYVPKGDGSDVTLMGIDEAAFNDFLEDRGLDKYRGQIAPRNAFRSSWLNKFDMRISQDLPAPLAGHRARFVLDIENLGNLLNNDWGRFSQVGFPFLVPAVEVSIDPATGKYIYSNLRTQSPNRVDVLASVWRMSVGLMYDF